MEWFIKKNVNHFHAINVLVFFQFIECFNSGWLINIMCYYNEIGYFFQSNPIYKMIMKNTECKVKKINKIKHA